MAEVVPRLKGLTQGGYERAYRHRGRLFKTSTHQLIADLLDSLRVPFKENVRIPAEDLVRECVVRLPDAEYMNARCFESIHLHNAVATWSARPGWMPTM